MSGLWRMPSADSARGGLDAATPESTLCPNARLSVYVSRLKTRPNGLLFLARRGEKEAGEIEWGKQGFSQMGQAEAAH